MIANPIFRSILTPQAGAGVVSVTPASFSNLQGWWKADSFSLPTNTAIGGAGNHWIDQSGNSNDLYQNSTGNQPTYITGAIGTMPVITFGTSGGTKYLNFTSGINVAPSMTYGPFTIIWVGWATDDSMMFGNSGANIQFRRYNNGALVLTEYFGYIAHNSSPLSVPFGTTPLMCSWRQNTGASTGIFRENKASKGAFSDQGYSSSDVILNWMGNTSYGASLLGATAEACIYTSYLSDAQMDSLYDTYFKARWSLP